MKINPTKSPIEVLLFYSGWNCFRKMLFAVMVVFVQDYPIVQIGSQIAASGVMLAYLIRYLPFSTLQYNVVKILNELFMISVYLHLLMVVPYIFDMTVRFFPS